MNPLMSSFARHAVAAAMAVGSCALTTAAYAQAPAQASASRPLPVRAAALPPTPGPWSASAGAAPQEPPQASPPPAVSPSRFARGSRWSAYFAYGFNQAVFNSAPGIDIATAGLRWTYLWEAKGSGLFRGQPGLGIEVVPLMRFVENDRTIGAIGANLLYEHHFVVAGRVRPIWRIGAGFLYAADEVPPGATRHNFSLLTDLGVDFLLSARAALFAGYRLHHVSNANTGDRNPGINAHSLLFGLSFSR